MSLEFKIGFIFSLIGVIIPLFAFLIKSFYTLKSTDEALKSVKLTLDIVQKELETRKMTDVAVNEKIKTIFNRLDKLERKVDL